MTKVKIGNRYFESVEGIVVNDNNGDKSLYSKPSWNENNSNKAGYIQERPFYSEHKQFSWDGDKSLKSYIALESLQQKYNIQTLELLGTCNTAPELMIGSLCSLDKNNTSTTYYVEGYCTTPLQVEHFFIDNPTGSIALIPGTILGFPPTWAIGTILINNEKKPIFALIPEGGIEQASPAGIYTWNTAEESLPYLSKYVYDDIVINENYGNFFNYLKNPIYILPTEQLTDIINIDLSQFSKGDIVLVTTGNVI